MEKHVEVKGDPPVENISAFNGVFQSLRAARLAVSASDSDSGEILGVMRGVMAGVCRLLGVA
jgi:hypothetical protein